MQYHSNIRMFSGGSYTAQSPFCEPPLTGAPFGASFFRNNK